MSRAEIRQFGTKLRALRTQRSLTLKQLAEALGHASHSYVCELEAGKKMPTVELVLHVAILFDVSTDALLRDDMELPS